MKMMVKIKGYNKEYVYEQYTRIVDDFKDYEKITKVKMLNDIYNIYSDYNNIIDICTTRELKYLDKVMKNTITFDDFIADPEKNSIEYLNHKYDWERRTLSNKFLLDYDYYGFSSIPEEIALSVEKALKKVKWNEKKKIDYLNEILISYCKIQVESLINPLISFVCGVTGLEEEVIFGHIVTNKLFKYYVFLTRDDFGVFGKNVPILIYNDYFDIIDKVREQRKSQGIAGGRKIDIGTYRTLFYNDFDIENKKIKKFLDYTEKDRLFNIKFMDDIMYFSILNLDREPLKEKISRFAEFKGDALIKLFQLMDEAMDEMPSAALNGFTPNEVRKIKIREQNVLSSKMKKYRKQNNACLSKKDKTLFYKLYFALLEFTNKKYKINSRLKIYGHTGIDPNELLHVIEKFWEFKDSIIIEFCLSNPFKFSKEELQLVGKFKNGRRDRFILAEYENEYTALMSEDRIYMIKGLNDNIDNIISINDLPCFVETSIIPFKDYIVYDGLFSRTSIKMGVEFAEMVEKELEEKMIYYHL